MNGDTQAAFAVALIAFQSELPQVSKGKTAVVKTKQGGEYRYTYADLSDIIAVVTPLLTKHGLAFTAHPAVVDGVFLLRCSLLHKEGHRECGDYPMPDASQHSPQEIGTAITYARRYALTALVGIAPDEDDDGQSASNTRAAPRSVAGAHIGALKAQVWTRAQDVGLTNADDLAADFVQWSGGKVLSDATEVDLSQYLGYLNRQGVPV